MVGSLAKRPLKRLRSSFTADSQDVKIMYEIQSKLFFKWPKQMGSDLSTRDIKLRCSYYKDHWHKTKNCKTLKQFLERLVEQVHLTEYVKLDGKKVDQSKEAEEKVDVVQANQLVTGVIEAIHGITDRSATTKNYFRARLTSAQFWSQPHLIAEVMSILAPKRDMENDLI